ncbi:DUF5444 family protein [Salmonella enterica]
MGWEDCQDEDWNRNHAA